MNVYCPNQDNPKFVQEIDEKCIEASHKIILAGDFNVALNNDLDTG